MSGRAALKRNSETDLRDEYLFYFRELKAFLDKTAAAGNGSMVVLC